MRVTPDGYVVLEGSTAMQELRKSASDFVARKREELVRSGVLVLAAPGLLRFTHDALFDSPSTAACIIAGGNTNGRTHWKRDGISLKEIQEREAPTPEG